VGDSDCSKCNLFAQLRPKLNPYMVYLCLHGLKSGNFQHFHAKINQADVKHLIRCTAARKSEEKRAFLIHNIYYIASRNSSDLHNPAELPCGFGFCIW